MDSEKWTEYDRELETNATSECEFSCCCCSELIHVGDPMFRGMANGDHDIWDVLACCRGCHEELADLDGPASSDYRSAGWDLRRVS
jgi:hypothetical protein